MMSVVEPEAAFGWVPYHVAKVPQADIGISKIGCPLDQRRLLYGSLF